MCTNTICYNIDNIHIKRRDFSKFPYVKFKVLNKEITKTQRELIYRIFIEHINQAYKKKSSSIEDELKLILQESYEELYLLSDSNYYLTIVTYLISYSLIKKDLSKTKFQCYSLILLNSTKFLKFYISLININDIVIKNPSMFPPLGFSRFIKYPDKVIDEYFHDFLSVKDHSFIFIEVQKPSFGVLVKHAGEFNINKAIKSLPLTEEQKNELKLLDTISR